ncbi:hypothetical protein ACFYSC_36730 [Streptosporangium sp. NPDC004379]|uniref:hypothetical protein n=1 Tax=Streptosporangium sp. NPDC004379 TaxID=3366189 RepID=UPI0036B06538
MRGGVLLWGGAGVAVVAMAGLGVHLVRVGLDAADKLASVCGLFVAVAGLGVAVYALIADPARGGVRQRATAIRRGRVRQAGRDISEGSRPVVFDNGSAADEAHPEVRQWGKATGDGQVDQAGRDIHQR